MDIMWGGSERITLKDLGRLLRRREQSPSLKKESIIRRVTP